MKSVISTAIFFFFVYSLLMAQDTTNTSIESLKGAFGQASTSVSTDSSSQEVDVADTFRIDSQPLYITVNDDRLKVKGHKKNGVASLKAYVDSNSDDFVKYLSDKLKQSYNAKLKRKGGMYVVMEAALMEISNRPVNMWAEVEAQGDEVYINAAFELNDHYFIDSKDNADEFEKSRSFVHFLVKGYYIDYYTSLLNEMQEQYDDVVKQKENLLAERKFINNKIVQYKNKQATNLKRIAKNEALIEKSDSRIEVNEAEEEMLEQQLKELESEIDEINSNKGASSEELAAALEKVSDKQKDIQKVHKSKEKVEKNIAKDEALIHKAATKNEDDRHENEHFDELIAQAEKELAQKDVEIQEKEKVVAKKQAYLDKISIKLKNIY